MFRFSFFLILFFCTIFPICPENAWIISAEQFTLVDIPETYAYLAQEIPQLLLTEISTFSLRISTKEEVQARKKIELAEKKTAILRDIAKIQNNIDILFFSTENKDEIKKKEKNYKQQIEKQTKELKIIERTITELEENDITIQETEEKIKLYGNKTTLYERKNNISLNQSLQKDGISALISGEIEDIAGYIYVSVSIHTGIKELPLLIAHDASTYDQINNLVKNLSNQLQSHITNKKTVLIDFSVKPENALVFINDILIDPKQRYTISEGNYEISVKSTGYKTIDKIIYIGNHNHEKIDITLESLQKQQVHIDASIKTHFILNSNKFDSIPLDISIVNFPAIGFFEHREIHTWFVIEDSFTHKTDPKTSFFTIDTKKNAEKIEKQRKIMYLSLGVFYISLPIALLLYGQATSYVDAYSTLKIENTNANYNKINTMIKNAQIAMAVSIGLGVHYAYQVGKYMFVVNKVLPQTSK